MAVKDQQSKLVFRLQVARTRERRLVRKSVFSAPRGGRKLAPEDEKKEREKERKTEISLVGRVSRAREAQKCGGWRRIDLPRFFPPLPQLRSI